MNEQNNKLELLKKRCKTSEKVITVLQVIALIGIVGALVGAISCFMFKDTINQAMAEQIAAGTATVEDFKISTGTSGLFIFKIDYEEFFKVGNYATPLAINCVIATVITSLCFYLLSIFKTIFRNLIKEDNPFSDTILKGLKACFIVVTVLLVLFVGFGPGVVGGLLCWCIYSILEYGRVLQTEIDETL